MYWLECEKMFCSIFSIYVLFFQNNVYFIESKTHIPWRKKKYNDADNNLRFRNNKNKGYDKNKR